jgi:hypothetical protein
MKSVSANRTAQDHTSVAPVTGFISCGWLQAVAGL